MTPTSATGNNRSGFSLVELMVVTAVMGLLAAAVVLAAPDPRPSVGAEADRLAAKLTRARQQAIVDNRRVEAVIDTRGYGFETMRGGARVVLDDKAWRRIELTTETGVSASGGLPARVGFDPTGAADPAEVTLSRGDRRAVVRVDEAGEVTVDAA